MPGEIPVSWTLHGEVNSRIFTLTGKGTADLETGTTEFRLSAKPGFPPGFDPAITQFVCNYPLAGYVAVPAGPVSIRDAVVQKLFVRPRRQITISDAGGELIVRLQALTTMTIEPAGISVTNYMSGTSQLPGAVSSVSGEEVLVPGGPGAAVGVAQYRVELDNGQVLDGLTVVPYRFDRTEVRVSAAARAIGNQVCERISATEVTLRATSQWREFAPALAG